MKRKAVGIAASVVLLATTVTGLADIVYNKYNIHYYSRADREGLTLIASYANYVGDADGHGFIPANTAVEIGRWRGGFLVTVVETKERIYFEFKEANMRMSVREYQKLLFADQKTSYDALSKEDQEGIRAGKVSVGMTREGTKIAWGYPATHRTPSLDANQWVYWRNRFRTIAVDFEEDKVVNVKM